MNTNKKYNKADGKKESRENGRNLCFHDWLIVRELKGLDEAYDERMRCFNYGVLMLAENEDSDERQKLYDKMLEERERIRAIYIQRRNELKAGFTGRQEKGIKGYVDTDMRNRIERLSEYGHGYVLSDKEAKAALNKVYGCIDEVSEFKDDSIVEAVLDERNLSKKPDTVFVFNDHSELKGLRRFTNPIDDVGPVVGLEDFVNMDSWHKYTPEELEEMDIVKGTLAKGRLHPDDVGKELTPEMLNRVIWERAEEDE